MHPSGPRFSGVRTGVLRLEVVLERELDRAWGRHGGVRSELRREGVVAPARPLREVAHFERLHCEASTVAAEREALLKRGVRVEVLRVVLEPGDRRQWSALAGTEQRPQRVGLFGRQLADGVAREVEARARRNPGARHAQRLVDPVTSETVAVQVAAVGDDVEWRFTAVVDNHAELDAERQIELAVNLEAMTTVLGVGAKAQAGL